MDQEIELKLELSSDAAEAFEQLALLPGESDRAELKAVYFDTPDRQLHAQGYTLRIRRSGEKRVQTVKADGGGQGGGLFARAEWEMPVADDRPVIDSRTPLGAVLGDAAEMLEPAFKVEVERRTWVVKEGAAKIELVLDRGWVGTGERQAPICEAELEIKSGRPDALFSLARRIAVAVPVRMGVAAKSERGYRLLAPAPSCFKAEPIMLEAGVGAREAFEVIVRACVRQYRLNEDLLLDHYEPRALHQARVAVRRLRSALTLFKPKLKDQDVARFQDDLRWLAKLLGEARDLDVLIERIRPDGLHEQISEARTIVHGRVIEALQSARARALMIDIVEWLTLRSDDGNDDGQADAFAARRLNQFHRWVRKHADRLAKLDDEHRHEVRKKAKKLRYAAEFFGSLFDGKKQQRRYGRYIEGLEDLQDVLGALNDLASTGTILAQHGLPTDAELSGGARGKKKLLAAAQDAYEALADAKLFWR